MTKLWEDYEDKTSHSSNIWHNILNIVIFTAVALTSWYLMPKSDVIPEYTYEIGKPWTYEELTADVDFPVYKTDEMLVTEQNEVLRDFCPYYTQISQNTSPLYIVSAQELEQLRQNGYTKIKIIGEKHIAEVVNLNEILTPDMAYIQTGEELLPNITYDSIQTQRIRRSLLESVSSTQGIVHSGQTIVRTGDIITPEIQQLLISYLHGNTGKRQRSTFIPIQAGRLALTLVIMSMLVIYLLVFRHDLWCTRNVRFFCLMMFLFFVGTFLTMQHTQNYTYSKAIMFIPFVWIPITTRVFYDARTANMVNLVTILTIAIVMPAPLLFILTQISVGYVAVASLKDMSQRTQLVRTAGFVMLTFLIVYVGGMCIQTNGMAELHWDWRIPVYTLIEGVIVIFAYGFIFIFEQSFRMVSGITLVELSNVNSNLMHEFAEKAPGTFQHSLQVSNLATEAAKRIDANVLLVRAGALYHDIGKMNAPQNYTENQNGGINPLLAMGSQKAAQTIISHVEEGIRLAHRHHLPPVIVRFIGTHHGKSLVKYFYNTEVNENPETIVDKKAFSYPGPKPHTAEECILMMADAVEARSRSLKEYTEEQINKMVDDMIQQQIEGGQFSMSTLSFRDIEIIKDVFKEKLMTIYHHRIQYPELVEKSR